MSTALAVVALAANGWREDFGTGTLDPDRWQRTVAGDLRTHEVRSAPAADGNGFRLRLAADTRGTNDHDVNHLGVVSRCAVVLGSDARVGVELDWLSIRYVGVPPRVHDTQRRSRRAVGKATVPSGT